MDQKPRAKTREYGVEGQVTASVIGAIIWGAIFARLGSMGNQLALGSFTGVVIGAIVGFGFAKGVIGPIIPCMSAFAVLGALLGPASSYDPLSSALCGAGIGAFVGATGVRGICAMIGGLMLTNEGLVSGDVSAWIGMAVGGGIGWCSAHLIVWTARRIYAWFHPM